MHKSWERTLDPRPEWPEGWSGPPHTRGPAGPPRGTRWAGRASWPRVPWARARVPGAKAVGDRTPLSVYPGGGWPGAPRTGAGQSTGGARGPGAPPPARAPHLLALLLVALHRPRVRPVAVGAVGAAVLPHAATLLHLGVAEGAVGAVGAAQGHAPQGDAPLLAAFAAVPQRVGLLGVAAGGGRVRPRPPPAATERPRASLAGV